MGVSYHRGTGEVEITVSRRALALAVVFLHGPLDVGLTLAAWHLESNALVSMLGPLPWLGVKLAALAALPVALYGIDREPWLPGDQYVKSYADEITISLLSLTLVLGVVLIAPNAVVIAAIG